MLIDIESLLRPISELEPAGPNLEYSAEFAELERAAQGTPERQMGNATLPGQAPDPALVVERAVSLLRRTKDLRIALHLLRALLARGGLRAFLHALELLSALLEQFWQHVHPGCDPEEGVDLVARKNALSALGAPELLHELRRSTLLESQSHGPLGVSDLITATSTASLSGQSAHAALARVEATFREQAPQALAALLAAIERARAHVSALIVPFSNLGASAPDLSGLSATLAQLELGVRQHLPGARERHASLDRASEAPRQNAFQPSASVPPRSAPETALLDIKSRHDVVRCLERIRAYYQLHEPSSPLPLLLERCERLATLDFLGIVKEIAPEALTKLELVAGSAVSSRTK